LHADELLHSRKHSLHISRHRAKIISERVRVVSGVFAILTPLWIVVDLLIFPWPVWGYLAVMRLLSSAAFYGLARVKNERRVLGTAFLMLGAMLAIPPLFFLASQPLLMSLEGGPLLVISIKLYSLLPFIVVAGLSVFPLTLLEVVIAAAAVLAIFVTSTAYHPTQLVSDLVITLWMFLLVMGVSCFAGMSQLHYIIYLVSQASMDVLTGAYTRRSGRETLDLQFRLAARTNSSLTVMFLDIDNFKSINDTHGHEQGDKVLLEMARSLHACLRSSDVLIRWGGEEFLIVLSDNAAEGAAIVLRRISEHRLGLRPDGTPVTASIGVAERKTDACSDWEQLIELADNRMYQSKTSGKNCCTGFSSTTTVKDVVSSS
jgi:diguanylate cyclase (GGDEF)-like protein